MEKKTRKAVTEITDDSLNDDKDDEKTNTDHGKILIQLTIYCLVNSFVYVLWV